MKSLHNHSIKRDKIDKNSMKSVYSNQMHILFSWKLEINSSHHLIEFEQDEEVAINSANGIYLEQFAELLVKIWIAER